MIGPLPVDAPPTGSGIETNRYLYGVMLPEPDGIDVLPTRGIGNREIRFMPHREIGAVVSPVEPGRFTHGRGAELVRNLRAHTGVLERLASHHTILPAGFGIELAAEDLENWLEQKYDDLRDELERLRGRVELKITGSFTEDGMVTAAIHYHPDLLKTLRHCRTTDRRIQFGKAMAAAGRKAAGEQARQLLKRLKPFAEEIAKGKVGDRGILSLSLLIKRPNIAEVDRRLRDFDAECPGEIELACIGPLPPYSFVAPLLERKEGCHGFA